MSHKKESLKDTKESFYGQEIELILCKICQQPCDGFGVETCCKQHKIEWERLKDFHREDPFERVRDIYYAMDVMKKIYDREAGIVRRAKQKQAKAQAIQTD